MTLVFVSLAQTETLVSANHVTLTPPHSPVSLLLPSSRLLWLCMHPHPLSHPLSHPLPQPNPCPCPPRHVGCSPSPLTESPGLEGRQELQRRCLSRLVGENRAVHSPRTLPLLSAALSETFGPHRPGSVWRWCSLASLSREREFSQVQPSLLSTVFLFQCYLSIYLSIPNHCLEVE